MTDLPPDRARWRLTLHRRTFAAVAYAGETGITEITGARSRRLETALNAPAKLTFSMDGRDPAAAYVDELTTEVMAWRHDPESGEDRLMFRGVVAQSEDTITEQAHTVNFTAHDWLAVLTRRFLTWPTDSVYTQTDQDAIVAGLVGSATNMTSGDGSVSFVPGASLPLTVTKVNPDGSARPANSGRLRDRAYPGQTSTGQAITDLGACLDGFDVDIKPAADTDGTDHLRVFYPAQGVSRRDLALAYGSSVSHVTRATNSAEYGNYWRVLGQSPTEEGAPQVFADRWNTDANNVGQVPVGLWPSGVNASDVSDPSTLGEKAAGELARAGELVASFTLGLRPGWFRPDHPAMGDVCPLLVRSGRVDESRTLRVLGINYAIGDDGQEDVELTVGRPAVSLSALFRDTRKDVDALARR